VDGLRAKAGPRSARAKEDEMDQDNRNRENPNLDDEMERDTGIRRESQVRGSLGVPPSGGAASGSRDLDESIPEFERGSDEDRGSER
jgi:hypothetical protein